MRDVKTDGKFVIALGRAMQHVHKKSVPMLRENGLTTSQFSVLEVLYQKHELTIAEICNAVLSTSGNMTVVIRNLEQLGLVQRVQNPADKRSFLITLTEQGLQVISTVFPVHMQLVGEQLSALTTEEIDTVISILRKLR